MSFEMPQSFNIARDLVMARQAFDIKKNTGAMVNRREAAHERMIRESRENREKRAQIAREEKAIRELKKQNQILASQNRVSTTPQPTDFRPQLSPRQELEIRESIEKQKTERLRMELEYKEKQEAKREAAKQKQEAERKKQEAEWEAAKKKRVEPAQNEIRQLTEVFGEPDIEELVFNYDRTSIRMNIYIWVGCCSFCELTKSSIEAGMVSPVFERMAKEEREFREKLLKEQKGKVGEIKDIQVVRYYCSCGSKISVISDKMEYCKQCHELLSLKTEEGSENRERWIKCDHELAADEANDLVAAASGLRPPLPPVPGSRRRYISQTADRICDRYKCIDSKCHGEYSFQCVLSYDEEWGLLRRTMFADKSKLLQLEEIKQNRAQENKAGEDHGEVRGAAKLEAQLEKSKSRGAKLIEEEVMPVPGQTEAVIEEVSQGTSGVVYDGRELSDDLLTVIGSCLLYLISIDGKFSSSEQTWVDEHLGEGASEKLLEEIDKINWEEHFEMIRQGVSNLTEADKQFLVSDAKAMFLDLLCMDDLTAEEHSRLQEFMDFLKGSSDS